MTTRAALVALIVAWTAATPAWAQKAGKPENKAEYLPDLTTVQWESAKPTLVGLEGKTVLVVTFAASAPDWFVNAVAQIKEAMTNRPVIVLAVCINDGNERARLILDQVGLTGPNVFLGSSPTLAAAMGFNNEFWNWALIDATGKIAKSGGLNVFWTDSAPKQYVVGTAVARQAELGRFEYVAPSLSEKVAPIAWKLEVGDAFTDAEAALLRNKLSAAEKAALNGLLDRYVKQQTERMKTLAARDVAGKLEAADIAEILSAGFKNRPEGKDAKTLLGELKREKELRPEWQAKTEYQRAAAVPDPILRLQAFSAVAKKSPGTVYGAKAAAALTGGQPAKEDPVDK